MRSWSRFAKELNEEDKRGVAEQLTEEELAIFDILTKPDARLAAEREKGSQADRPATTANAEAGQARIGLAEEAANPCRRVFDGEDGAGRFAPHLHAGTLPGKMRFGVSPRRKERLRGGWSLKTPCSHQLWARHVWGAL